MANVTPWNITLCPSCGEPSHVIDSRRTAKSHTSVRRRRACKPCARRWTTYEVLEEDYRTLFVTPKKIGMVIGNLTIAMNFLRSLTNDGEPK